MHVNFSFPAPPVTNLTSSLKYVMQRTRKKYNELCQKCIIKSREAIIMICTTGFVDIAIRLIFIFRTIKVEVTNCN